MDNSGGGIEMFLPYLIVSAPLAIIVFFIAKRKAKYAILFAFFTFAPVVNICLIVYLLSLTDKSLYARLDRLEKLVGRDNAKGALSPADNK